MSVTRKIQQEYNDQVKEWNKTKTAIPPSVSITRWLKAAHQGRITSSFPELDAEDDFKDLNFTLKELLENKWLQTRAGTLYELERMQSPWDARNLLSGDSYG